MRRMRANRSDSAGHPRKLTSAKSSSHRTLANGCEWAKGRAGAARDGLLISRFSVRVRGGSPQNQSQIPNGRSSVGRPSWLFDSQPSKNACARCASIASGGPNGQASGQSHSWLGSSGTCPTLTRATGVLLTLKYESQDQASAHASAQVQQGQPTSHAAVPARPLANSTWPSNSSIALGAADENRGDPHPLLASRGQRSRRTGRYLVSHRELPGISLGLSGEELAPPAALQARKFAHIKLGCRDARAVIAH
jgi:hypothetical protein